MADLDKNVAAVPIPAPASHQETRGRILDAAETLFAEEGFQVVSLRRITAAAGVNLAAVNYHFGSREALISEVISRVLDPINRERLRLLDAYEAEAAESGQPVTVERIMEAAFRPVVLDMPRSGEANRRFLKLAGQCLGERAEHFPETMQRVFREVSDRFVAALRKVLPELSEADIYWRMHFTIATLLSTLTQHDRLMAMSKGAVGAVGAEETMAQLITFTVAGMKAPAPVVSPAEKSRGRDGKVVTAGFAVVLGLFGASCAATAPPDSRDHADVGEIPDEWRAEGAEAAPKESLALADRGWVESFGDKRLEELVSIALDYNKDLAAAAARIDMAEASARIAGADLYPQAQGLFRGTRQKRVFVGFPFGGDPAAGGGGGGESLTFGSLSNQFDLSLDLSWEIDLWGRVRAGQSAAISEYQGTVADRAAAELSIAGQVAKAWFELQAAEEQVTLAEKAIEVFERTETAIRDRFEAGIDAVGQGNLASQLRLSMVDVETARDTLVTRSERVERTARQIEVLLGRYPGGREKTGGKLPTLEGKPPAGMPADLLDRRPDLHASERRLAAADRRLLEAKRALLPTISLTGGAGTSTPEIEDLLDRNFSIWSLAGGLAQPLLTGGRLRHGILFKRAELVEAAAEFEKTVLTAFAEVENALASEGFLAEREKVLRRAAKLALEAHLSAAEEFAEGTGDILTMLSAQQTLFVKETQLIAVRRERLQNRVALHLALGGGFEAAHVPFVAAKEPDS